jgi:hypothetical protein
MSKRRATSWHSTSKLSRPEVFRVAASGACDPQVVVKYLEGQTVSPMSIVRVERGLRDTGHETLVRGAPAAAARTESSAPPPPESR